MKTLTFQCEENPDMYRELCRYAGMLIWGADRGFGPGTAMGVFDDENQLAAAIIYHNNDDWASIIEYSGAGEDPR